MNKEERVERKEEEKRRAERRRRVQVLREIRDDANGHQVSLVTVATMNIRAPP